MGQTVWGGLEAPACHFPGGKSDGGGGRASVRTGGGGRFPVKTLTFSQGHTKLFYFVLYLPP